MFNLTTSVASRIKGDIPGGSVCDRSENPLGMTTIKKTERILVVEDEEPIREIISAMLSAGGYQCRTTASGFEALDLLISGEKFALMLSGLSQLCEADMLKHASKKSPNMPVVLITATYDMSVILTCIRDGAYDYLLKPFCREQLLAVVRRTLEYRRLRLENRTYKSRLAKKDSSRSRV